MGKAFLALFVVVGLFLALIVCFPVNHTQETPSVVSNSVDGSVIESHMKTVCDNASIDMFGRDFAEYDQAVEYCVKGLMYSYRQIGHWPGPEMNGNVSNAFFAAQQAADFWALLDTPFVYRSEDGRDVIMQYMKSEREAYGL